ncbi:hypothetical protein ACOSQ3_032702 [Xanthoceras sorbifolium]
MSNVARAVARDLPLGRKYPLGCYNKKGANISEDFLRAIPSKRPCVSVKTSNARSFEGAIPDDVVPLKVLPVSMENDVISDSVRVEEQREKSHTFSQCPSIGTGAGLSMG